MERLGHRVPVRSHHGNASRRGLRSGERDFGGRGVGGRGAGRLSRHDQGQRGRGREGHPHGGLCGERGRRLPPGFGGGSRFSHLHHEIVHGVATPGGPADRGRVWRGTGFERTRLFRAAPTSEDHRGGTPRGGLGPRLAPDGESGGAAGPSGGICQRGYGGVSLFGERRTILLSGAQPAAAGGTSRDGDDHQGQPARHAATSGHGHTPPQHSGDSGALWTHPLF
mmetsp:Transcript_29019/g.66416  ORF Transcript_29019/g.66416 Transcript_29019/m.66416 type:complete len:224 (+) Transcript_29019:676-1347(+)